VKQHDDQKVKDYGVTLAIDMIRRLAQGGVRGVHFCTLNLEKSVQRVLEGLAWADDEKLHPSNKLISVCPRFIILKTAMSELSQEGELKMRSRKLI